MPKVFGKTLIVIFSLVLFFVLLFVSIEMVVYNLPYYKWHYEHRNIDNEAKMSIEDLMIVTEKMVDYLKGDVDNLDIIASVDGEVQEVFGEREKDHMVDVKSLAVSMNQFKNIGFFLIMFILFLSIKNKKWLINMLGSIKIVFIFTGIIILLIGGLLISDFEKYFTIFHLIFFDNDLWLLDPRTDVLINLVPEIFFFTTAMLVIGIFAILSIITIIIAELTKKKIRRKLE